MVYVLDEELQRTVRKLICYAERKHLMPVKKWGMNLCEYCNSNTDIPIEN